MRAKLLTALISGLVVLSLLFVLMAWSAKSVSEYPAFMQQRRPLVMAHRGGAGLWPENTMYAFTQAIEMGVDVLEMDMHSTAEGVLVIIHDSTVDRTTNGTGRVNDLTLAQLEKLDAGYRWSPDGGKTFPFRGRGLTVPTLEEVFAKFPGTRLNIDIKQEQPSVVRPFCWMIRESGMTDKVMVASFKSEVLDEFRRECAEVATSASVADVRKFLASHTASPETAHAAMANALQVPEYAGGRQVLTREFVEAAHRRHLEVHAWTINDQAAMRRLLEIGVDGIITDYPDRLIMMLGSPQGPKR